MRVQQIKTTPHTLATIPFDIGTALTDASWRTNPSWPLPLSATREMLRTIYIALASLIIDGDKSGADVLGLAVHRIAASVGALTDAAMLAEAGNRQKIEFTGCNPVLDWFAGKAKGGSPPEYNMADAIPAAPRFLQLRSAARMVTLNQPGVIFRAFAVPRHTAVFHNSLLRDVAWRGQGAISFRHAGSFLQAARHTTVPRSDKAIDLASYVGDALFPGLPLGSSYRERLIKLAMPILIKVLAEAERDLEGLSRLAALPNSMWGGSGGYYPARALALAIQRRGGTATFFDHGGCSGMFAWTEAFQLAELWPANCFVTMTSKTARLVEETAVASPLGHRRPKIVGHDGDPDFAAISPLPRAPRSRRRKVIYPLGPFYGFRQWFPPLLPDPVYYQLMMRLIEALNSLPIDLVCKPRPEQGRNHPAEVIGATDYRLFEDVLPEADTVVFDDVHSTTFWKTLCSDRRVVILDLGYDKFVPEIERLIRSRCRIVPSWADENNIPQFNLDNLADAILGEEFSEIDTDPFRRLLAKDSFGSVALTL
jgi:hypothetical protein